MKCFQLTITACPPGHVLHSTDDSREYECRCNLENDQNIISCVQNESKVILKVYITNVCMYICTYVYIYVFMYVCMYVCMYVSVCLYVY